MPAPGTLIVIPETMVNTDTKLTATSSSGATPSPPQSHPVTGPGRHARRLKFQGCCLMTDKQLEQHYKLHRLTDDELATVGLQRKSLIDDYRAMHEISQMHMLEAKREKALRDDTPENRAKRIKELQLRLGMRPHKTYKFQLLNQLVRVMDAESDPAAIFPEPLPFYFDVLYLESLEVRQLPPKYRELRRFDAFYDHLDSMFSHGERNKAIDVVVDAFVRLKRRRMQVSQVPIPSGYMSPRSFDFMPQRF